MLVGGANHLSLCAFAGEVSVSGADDEDGLPPALNRALGTLDAERTSAWSAWVTLYRSKLREHGVDDAVRRKQQDSVNPSIIPRNHVMQEVRAGSGQLHS